MEVFRTDEAIKIIWEKLRQCDEAITAKQPWKLSDAMEIKSILEPITQDITDSAKLLSPIMPEISEKIIKIFTAEEVKKGESLFPRI